jgi:predicted nucleotidyltransferase
VSEPEETQARIVDVLRGVPGLRLAVLFGSHAVQAAGPHSDVDIGVRWQAGGRLVDDLRLQAELTLAAGRDVDLVLLDEASTLLRWEVARRGLPLFEARPGEFARFRATAASEWADFGHGVIDAPLAARLALRSRVAHGYASPDFARLWRETPEGVAAFRVYAAAIAARLGSAGSC